jgi:hypothetical protein
MDLQEGAPSVSLQRAEPIAFGSGTRGCSPGKAAALLMTTGSSPSSAGAGACRMSKSWPKSCISGTPGPLTTWPIWRIGRRQGTTLVSQSQPGMVVGT